MGPAHSAFGAGRFVVRGTLGAGGAGVVYRAFDRQLQREVALKVLRQASGRDLYRFKREFRALADIVHPNLVALHELHAAGGDWYFTMELVEGVSFIDWVRPARGMTIGPQRTRQDIVASPPNDARLRGALVQLVDALIALHRAGKLHRDLKPSNVLVTAQGRVALLDFGLVTGMAEGDPERLAVGTPVYMSPEQAADQPLDEASDWYSVGCMLHEALTGCASRCCSHRRPRAPAASRSSSGSVRLPRRRRARSRAACRRRCSSAASWRPRPCGVRSRTRAGAGSRCWSRGAAASARAR
jgi:serine/threonine protein kinase